MMPFADRYTPQGLPWRVARRMSPRVRVKELRRQAGERRAIVPLPLEEILGPAPDPCDHSPPADEWREEALSCPTAALREDFLETYEQAEPEPDWFDEEGTAEDAVEVLGRPGARPDYSRFLAAMREKSSPSTSSGRTVEESALPVAPSGEECRRCGIPGFRGCAHQAPFVRPAPPPAAEGGQVSPRATAGAVLAALRGGPATIEQLRERGCGDVSRIRMHIDNLRAAGRVARVDGSVKAGTIATYALAGEAA